MGASSAIDAEPNVRHAARAAENIMREAGAVMGNSPRKGDGCCRSQLCLNITIQQHSRGVKLPENRRLNPIVILQADRFPLSINSPKSAHAESPIRLESHRASHCLLYGNHRLRLKWRAYGLLAMSNLGSHTTLLAANFSTSLACSFRSHSFFLLHKAVIRCLIRAISS